jgi:hypothetical protein
VAVYDETTEIYHSGRVHPRDVTREQEKNEASLEVGTTKHDVLILSLTLVLPVFPTL